MTEEQEPREIQALEQKTVFFYDDELVAVRGDDQSIYVSIRHLCDVLGLNRRGQVQRIQRNAVLNRGYRAGSLLTEGGPQMAGLLRVDLLPLWLTGLSTRAVRPELRERLDLYQDQAARVLWEAFQEGRLTADPTLDQLLTGESPAAQAYRTAAAIMKMARQQLLLEARLESQAGTLLDHEERLEHIEATLGDPGRHVTPDQASQLSQAVKAVAMALGARTRRNEYGGVYGELYRRYGITSYKLLPAGKFQEAMKWLGEWHQSLTGEAPF
jgi:hypothetical protein